MDDSLAIAAKFDVKILSVSGDVSAAAGRYSGLKNSVGEIIQFIDGDMVIDRNWFLDTLDLHEPSIIGCRKEIHMKPNACFIVSNDFYRYDHLQSVTRIGGFFQVKRRYLCGVSINPWLKMEEEGDLLIKLLASGMEGVFAYSKSGYYHLNYRFSKKGILSRYILEPSYRNEHLKVFINSILEKRFLKYCKVNRDYVFSILAFVFLILCLFKIEFLYAFMLIFAYMLKKSKWKSFLANTLSFPLKLLSILFEKKTSKIEIKSIYGEEEIIGSFNNKKFR
jgi:glycosyltransferase involved in cell wall biosynthesis